MCVRRDGRARTATVHRPMQRVQSILKSNLVLLPRDAIDARCARRFNA